MRLRPWLPLALLLLFAACKKQDAPAQPSSPANETAPATPPVQSAPSPQSAPLVAHIPLMKTAPAQKPARPLYYERELAPADLQGRSLYELTLLRNWIYARAGNVFYKQWLHDFFAKEPWYQPSGLDESKLSAIDKKNTELIAQHEAGLPKSELTARRDALLQRHEYAARPPPYALALSRDGKLAASGGRSLELWDAATGRLLHALEAAPHASPDQPEEGPTDDVVALGFSPDNTKLAAVRYFGRVAIYDVATGKPAGGFQAKEGVTAAFFTRSDPWRVLIGDGERAALLELATGKEPAASVATKHPFALSADGKIALLTTASTAVAIYDFGDQQPKRKIALGAEPSALALAADGHRGAALLANGELRVIDVDQGRVLHKIDPGQGAESIVLSRDGTRALVSFHGAQQSADLFQLDRGARIYSVEAGGGFAPPAVFSDDGSRIFFGGDAPRLADASNGQRLDSWTGHLPFPSEDVQIELQLLSRALGLVSPIGDESTRSPLDDPHLLDGLITVDRLKDLSRRDLRLIRNMIFARRGRPFKTESVRNYFERMEWYHADPAYTDQRLTKIDRENVKIVLSVEHERGGPMKEDEQLRLEMA